MFRRTCRLACKVYITNILVFTKSLHRPNNVFFSNGILKSFCNNIQYSVDLTTGNFRNVHKCISNIFCWIMYLSSHLPFRSTCHSMFQRIISIVERNLLLTLQIFYSDLDGRTRIWQHGRIWVSNTQLTGRGEYRVNPSGKLIWNLTGEFQKSLDGPVDQWIYVWCKVEISSFTVAIYRFTVWQCQVTICVYRGTFYKQCNHQCKTISINFSYFFKRLINLGFPNVEETFYTVLNYILISYQFHFGNRTASF